LQWSIPGEKIVMHQNQLFFLENYLKKNIPDICIKNGFILNNGKLYVEIVTGEKVEELDQAFQKLLDYLLIFHQKNSKLKLNTHIVKVQRRTDHSGLISPKIMRRAQLFWQGKF